MKKHIPNFITSLNIISGCIGIGFVIKGDIVLASYMIGFAAIFDFLDGLIARLLKAQSELGKQLDSLCDIVSFGVLPGVILFSLLSPIYAETEGAVSYLPFLAFLIPLFSALRLAKFNIDDRQTDHFIGLPVPANALFFASIPLIITFQSESFLGRILSNPVFLFLFILFFSYMLVSSIPLFSLKFKDTSWKNNYIQYIFILFSLILFIVLFYQSIPIILFLYIILSIIYYKIKK